jgi:hypothetical protein
VCESDAGRVLGCWNQYHREELKEPSSSRCASALGAPAELLRVSVYKSNDDDAKTLMHRLF